MSEDWVAIAKEVSQAISEVGFDVTVTRKAPSKLAWDTSGNPSPVIGTIRVIESAPSWSRKNTSGEQVYSKKLMCGAINFEPVIGDIINVRGVDCTVLQVNPMSPGGVNLGFSIMVSA